MIKYHHSHCVVTEKGLKFSKMPRPRPLKPRKILEHYEGELPSFLTLHKNNKIGTSLIRHILFLPQIIKGSRLNYTILANNVNYKLGSSTDEKNVHLKMRQLVDLGILLYIKEQGVVKLKASEQLKEYMESHVCDQFRESLSNI